MCEFNLSTIKKKNSNLQPTSCIDIAFDNEADSPRSSCCGRQVGVVCAAASVLARWCAG